MKIDDAKKALDKLITKSRVHLYKPIQIAEILFRYRTKKDIDLKQLETYRNASRKWRDVICLQFLGRTSTSSARYQDDVFNDNAIPQPVLCALGKENNKKNGIVEAYIYNRFRQRFAMMSKGMEYCKTHTKADFVLLDFINLFWNEAGLRRSIDKIYEIIVFALFSSIIDILKVSVTISFDSAKSSLLKEFEDFTKKVLSLSAENSNMTLPAKIFRLGVTNAADRGLDMYANFGLAIQIKHLSLTEDKAEEIVSSITSDRIVIVCKNSEEKTILSLLNQMGWKARIQSIITEQELVFWYEKALRSKYAKILGDKLLQNIIDEIQIEFPATNSEEFDDFLQTRAYQEINDPFWE